MSWLKPEPRVPVPSMMPVTVDVALSFPLSASYLLRSEEQAAAIMFVRPLTQKPKMNIRKFSKEQREWHLKYVHIDTE
jgi:hypothetical protein